MGGMRINFFKDESIEAYRSAFLGFYSNRFNRAKGMKREPTMKSKILKGFHVHGVTVGLMSYWWWHFSDNLLLLNIPGDLPG